jgi:lysophospholipase L1-like esterase
VKRTFFRLFFVVFGLMAGIILAEVTLMLFFPQRFLLLNPHDPFYGKYDPEIGWVNRENAEGHQRPNPEEPGGLISINGSGFRGREVTEEKAPSITRVMVFGDSITFGYGLNLEETYPFMLEKRLGEGFEVINASVIGYGMDQQYLLFRREVARYRPDVVIVGFSAGDIFDSACSVRFGNSKPFFRVSGNRLTLFNTPVPLKTPAQDFLKEKPTQALLYRSSHLYRLLFAWFTDPEELKKSLHRREMNNFEAMAVVSAVISEMKGECARIGCRLLFLVIPQEDWLRAEAGGRPEAPVVRRGHAAALRLVQESGVPFIDLWGSFLDNLDRGLFQKGDFVHPNVRGNRVIAEAIVESGLIERPVLEASPGQQGIKGIGQ